MKFEEALAALREGEKIWHPGMSKNEYYMKYPMKYDVKNYTNIALVKNKKKHVLMIENIIINISFLLSDRWKILGGIK